MRFELSPREAEFIERVRAFADAEVAHFSREWDEAEAFPHDIWTRLGRAGLLGITLARDLGGRGMGPAAYVEAVREVSRADPALGMNVAAMNALAIGHIGRFGDEAQRLRWLPGSVDGTVRLDWALTEPDAGSDAKRIATRAESIAGSSRVLLTGEKMFITNAGRADLVVVIGRRPDGELAAFLLETAQPGFRVIERIRTVGVRASHTTWFAMDGAEAEPTPCSFAEALSLLQLGRLGIAAIALGIAERALDETIRYANSRVQFDRRLGDMQSVQNMIADSVVEVQGAPLLLRDGAARLAAGEDAAIPASMAKLYASETSARVTSRAVQIHGGRGYATSHIVEKLWRDAKLTEIGEGCSEVQRLIIARAALRSAT